MPSTVVGLVPRSIARAAARELVSIARAEVQKQALSLKVEQSGAARATISEIESVVTDIGTRTLPRQRRLGSLSRLAKAITECAGEHSLLAMEKLAGSKGLDRVREFCESMPVEDVQVVGSALSIFANIAFQGFGHLVVQAGGHALIMQLLCPPATSSTPTTVLAFATAALSNMCASEVALCTFSPDERSRLIGALDKLLKQEASAALHNSANNAIGALRSINTLGRKEIERRRKAAWRTVEQSRSVHQAGWQSHLLSLQLEDKQRSTAASKMAVRWGRRVDRTAALFPTHRSHLSHRLPRTTHYLPRTTQRLRTSTYSVTPLTTDHRPLESALWQVAPAGRQASSRGSAGHSGSHQAARRACEAGALRWRRRGRWRV